MVTSQKAIEEAFNYLNTLPPEYLGTPTYPRLETVQRSGDEWRVVISFLTNIQGKFESSPNPLMKVLGQQRRFKEFEIDANTGEIIALRDPGPDKNIM